MIKYIMLGYVGLNLLGLALTQYPLPTFALIGAVAVFIAMVNIFKVIGHSAEPFEEPIED